MVQKMRQLAIAACVCLALVMMHSIAFAADETMVDVGLFYGVNSQYPFGISSDSGFTFGTANGDGISPLIDLGNYNTIKLYKAGYYENEQLVTTNATYYAGGNVRGAYTVRIGQSESSLNDLFDDFLAMKASAPELMVVYDGQWYIAYGCYINENAAITALNALTATYSNDMLSVMKQSRYQMVAYGDNMPLVSFNTSLQDFLFEAPLIEYSDVVYRNAIMVKRTPTSDYAVINHLSLDDYLYGVVPKEMAVGWPLEALKAQAVAARNFTLINMDAHAADGFDVCTTTDCQVYGGYSAEEALSNAAVDATSGVVLKYQNEIASCYYHANSGGETEDISNIWSGDLPYIKGKADPYSLGQPNATWTVTLDADTIEQGLKTAGYDIGTYQGVSIEELSDHGRVLKITFKGSKGNAVLLKENMRKIFGYTTVKSMYFSLEETTAGIAVRTSSKIESVSKETFYVMTSSGLAQVDQSAYAQQNSGVSTIASAQKTSQSDTDGLTLYGKGYGHGLGMSQWGAKVMAESGMSFDEILIFYYTGTTLDTINE
jgi:stage II sporulation protein D